MKSRSVLAVLLFVGLICAGFLTVSAKGFPAGGEKAAGQMLYVCGCGPDCKCTTVSAKAGTCACGKDLIPQRVLKIDQGNATLCPCGEDCTCQLSKTDPGKCECGKPVRTVNLKGLYACACGPSCTCNTVSNEPGKCGCGHDLKKVE